MVLKTKIYSNSCTPVLNINKISNTYPSGLKKWWYQSNTSINLAEYLVPSFSHNYWGSICTLECELWSFSLQEDLHIIKWNLSAHFAAKYSDYSYVFESTVKPGFCFWCDPNFAICVLKQVINVWHWELQSHICPLLTFLYYVIGTQISQFSAVS